MVEISPCRLLGHDAPTCTRTPAGPDRSARCAAAHRVSRSAAVECPSRPVTSTTILAASKRKSTPTDVATIAALNTLGGRPGKSTLPHELEEATLEDGLDRRVDQQPIEQPHADPPDPRSSCRRRSRTSGAVRPSRIALSMAASRQRWRSAPGQIAHRSGGRRHGTLEAPDRLDRRPPGASACALPAAPGAVHRELDGLERTIEGAKSRRDLVADPAGIASAKSADCRRRCQCQRTAAQHQVARLVDQSSRRGSATLHSCRHPARRVWDVRIVPAFAARRRGLDDVDPARHGVASVADRTGHRSCQLEPTRSVVS